MDADPATRRTDASPELRSWAAPIIERAPLPMVELEGAEHKVCFVNAAFCDLLDRKREELVGKRFAEIVSNGEYCVPVLDQVYQTGKFATQVVPEAGDSEEDYWIYAMWPALNAEACPERVIIQMTRSTRFRQNVAAMNEALLIGGLHQHELREAADKANAQLMIEIAERERVSQSLSETKGQLRRHVEGLEQTVAERTVQLRASVGELEAFSYSLVHDLRAPIRAIHGFTQMALDMAPDEVGPSAVELLNRVVKAAARMDSLIQDVISLNHVIRQPIKREKVEVDVLVRDLVRERPELASPRAEITIEGVLLPMLGHEAILSQCLTNLLSNAVKFVRPGAVPQVRVWSEERAVAAACVGRPSYQEGFVSEPGAKGAVVRLWIEDQGIGIPAASQKKIFEIFQRLHSAAQYEGSGIGLAIVSKGIQRMDGCMGVESEPGKGSRFWLELPKG